MSNTQTEIIEKYVKKVLKKKEKNNIENNIIKFVEVNIENGNNRDGYLSKLYFMTVKAQIRSSRSDKKYNLAVKVGKLGKDNKALKSPKSKSYSEFTSNVFKREIYLYNEILPKLTEFERTKGINLVFDNVPTCHGTYFEEGIELIVLDDLTKKNYHMNIPKDEPIARIKLIALLRTFGKWHAISAAMAKLDSGTFTKFVEELNKPLGDDFMTQKRKDLFRSNMETIYEFMLEDQLLTDKEDEKWENLQNRISSIVDRAIKGDEGFNVVSHGDCWANNFMFQKNSTPSILNWRFTARRNPVYDISGLLYSCASEKELTNWTHFLEIYHKSFLNHLEDLGIEDHSSIYSMDHMKEDWRKFADYGLVWSFTIMKNTFCEDVPDIMNEAPTTIEISEKNKRSLVDRSLYIFRSAIAHGVV